MQCKWLAAGVRAALVLAALGAAGATTTVRTFAVPGRPSLQLDVPLRWEDRVTWSRDGERVTIRLAPDAGSAFAMEIVPLWGAAAAPETRSREGVRRLVEESARRTLGVGDATSLGLEELRRADGAPGFLFGVTDETVPEPPPPGAFRSMTQGAVVVGSYVVTATILANDRWSPELADALEVLRTARATDDAPDGWRVPTEPPDARGRLGAVFTVEIPEGFRVASDNPFELRHDGLDATFAVAVTDGGTPWKTIVRDARRRIEARLGDQVLLRREGRCVAGGREAGELRYVDLREDRDVRQVVVAGPDATVTATWSVPTPRAREASSLEERLFGSLALAGH